MTQAKTALREASPWTAEFSEETENIPQDAILNDADYIQLAEDEEWVRELQDEPDWIGEFEKKAVINENEWLDEYRSTDDPWVAEFKQKNADLFPVNDDDEDSEKLAESAATLLATLEAERDAKLNNSQFVAYLRRLARREPGDAVPTSVIRQSEADFEEWREEFRRNIDSLVSPEDRVWEENWIKDWQQYNAEGIGYEGFAAREFRRYSFRQDNPFSAWPLDDLVRHHSVTLRDRIFVLEALVQREPTAERWSQLGLLQSDNEMDVQAIAAHQEALALNGHLAASWLGLALACINERCMSDAYDAIEHWLRTHPAYLHRAPLNVQSVNRNSELLRCFLLLANSDAPGSSASGDAGILLLTSVLQALDGQQSHSVETLRRAVAVSPPNGRSHLHNRLGALLANNGLYSEALREYEIAQSLGMNTPRSRYNQGISLMSLGRYAEAQESFVQALHLQVPVNNTSTVRPDLRDSYRCIWVTLGLLCELQGDSDGRIQADIGNLNAFLR